MHVFSPAQCVGYIAFILGVSAFLQKNDRRLKFLVAGESLVYAVHFTLLGNIPACASATISCFRTLLSLKTRSPYVAAAILAANVAAGFALAGNGSGWLPVIASCAGTIAVFLLRGIPMRLLLLCSTILWLTNNILSGSIGGTMLEATIAVVNISTILRLLFSPRSSLAALQESADAAD